MAYGSHPHAGISCNCDWDTDYIGNDHFVQCAHCAELWEALPDSKQKHPAANGLCDCTWRTTEFGRVNYFQCACCRELWTKYPEGTDWETAESEALKADFRDIQEAIASDSIRTALSIILARHMLWRSRALYDMMKVWLPKLTESPDVRRDAGTLLEECAARIQ